MTKRRKLATRPTPAIAMTIKLGSEQRVKLAEMKGAMGWGEAMERLIDTAYTRAKKRSAKLSQVLAKSIASDSEIPL